MYAIAVIDLGNLTHIVDRVFMMLVLDLDYCSGMNIASFFLQYEGLVSTSSETCTIDCFVVTII
jgi:hypothetical protein